MSFFPARRLVAAPLFALFAMVLGNRAPAQEFRGLAPKIKAVFDEHRVPGASVAIVVGGRIAWSEAFGTMEAGKDRPATTTTLFQVASISKPVSALAALRLVQAKKLDLDRPVKPFLSSVSFEGSETVTLRQLLSHTSGLSVGGYGGYVPGAEIPTMQQILSGERPANSAPVKPERPAGKYSYSGGGYCVVQQLISDTKGSAFPVAMKDLVLKPLKMNRSTYEQPLPANLLEKAAVGHDAESRPIDGHHRIHPEMAAAGLWTTADDLARYVIAVQTAYAGGGKAILSQALAGQMLTPQGPSAPGLGLMLTGDEKGNFSHNGWNAGFKARIAASKLPGIGLVILTNSERGDATYAQIEALVLEARK